MNAFFNKKNHKCNLSRKEIIDSVKISIEKNNNALAYLNNFVANDCDVEHIEYLKVVCKQVDKMYKDTLKRMGVKI